MCTLLFQNPPVIGFGGVSLDSPKAEPQEVFGRLRSFYQPKQCTIIREIHQNYHTFAAYLIPSKNWNLMTPLINTNAKRLSTHPRARAASKASMKPPSRKELAG